MGWYEGGGCGGLLGLEGGGRGGGGALRSFSVL